MANRDQPVNGKGSKLSLQKNSNLILLDAGRIILWSTNTFSISPVQLKLLKNGNLVIRTTEKNSTIWESFDSPTNTILPGQKLTGKLSLISYKSKTNFSSGFYKLHFDIDNVLRLLYNGDTRSSVYWPSPWLISWEDGRFTYNGSKIAVFDGHGRFQSSDQFKFTSKDLGLNVWRRLVVDYDGNLRLYSLLKNGDWFVSWQAIQESCSIHGVCGANSLCTYNSGLSKTCSCLPGYKMVSSTDWSNGCELIPSNSSDSHGDQPYYFVQISHADFYGYDYEYYRNSTMKECMGSCLKSSNCKGFQYKFHEGDKIYLCFPKVELLNGYRSPSFMGDIYLKLPKSSSQFLSQNQPKENINLDCSDAIHTQQLNRTYIYSNENESVEFLLWFACALGGVEFMLIFLVWCFLLKTRTRNHRKGYNLGSTGFRKFTYAELKRATKGFKEEIGRGGGGIVYKGVLDDCNRVAAIKRLNKDNKGRGEAEFLAEVGSLGRLNHMNLIDMWGYCAERNHRLLVYEYMELRSLAENLCSFKTLDSEKRFDIAMGTAKGLAYLHEECLECVLHCDVKPQNILLDLSYQPKVADFGLSKLLNRSGVNNSSFSRMRGTRGYMAPEWVCNLAITSKVDVYSYGIVVLEMLTGKKPAHKNLVTWVREKMENIAVEPSESSWIDEIMDPGFEGVYSPSKMKLVASVALLCVEEDKDARPTMSEVVEMLQDTVLLNCFNSLNI